MSDSKRIDKIEEYVPEKCVRHDEQIGRIAECAKEIKDAVKWAVRTTVGAVIIALVSALVTILLTQAFAR